MGYNTRFTGQLTFTNELTIPMVKKLQTILGEDPRDHPEWKPGRDISYIDLRLTKDFSGLEWNSETEKTYYLENAVNLVLDLMRKEWPEFGLTGQLAAQGEEVEDRWALMMEDGRAHKRKIAITGQRVVCPECNHKFILESASRT